MSVCVCVCECRKKTNQYDHHSPISALFRIGLVVEICADINWPISSSRT